MRRGGWLRRRKVRIRAKERGSHEWRRGRVGVRTRRRSHGARSMEESREVMMLEL